MRKVRAVLAVLTVSAGLVAAVSTPAQAATRELRGVYSSSSECYRVGAYGAQQGWWSNYSCEYRPIDYNGALYFLWA